MLRDAAKLLTPKRASELARFFYYQRVEGFDPPTKPHFDKETSVFFEEQVAKARQYLEYGSGGSTLVADRLGVPTVSVEGDRFYAEIVRSVLRTDTLVKIVIPRIGLTGEWSTPVFKSVAKARRYIDAPFSSAGKFPDLVLVDGRYRVACALEVARRANLGAHRSMIIFDDYFDRPQYRAAEERLGSPQRIGRAAVFHVGQQEIADRDLQSHLYHPL
ncbi:hypothetical protein [Sphingomonas hankyongi]|uniref:Class I SAM-dependent methyltransferase n=1 Tax=Sphingomonas hankyongi TaxID=2908209 RepID=A0ABT0S2M1_9SPHN|nr:hypothetical protein [Sphingomonas hankyongi]MCL6730120.1 hypothetical protein [Sphingomonas hankyongi]